MSHDIRTPLNGILGLIEIEELKDGDMQAARESRAKARVAANHLLSLINDILEMGKIEDRKLTLEHAPFNLKELCDDTLVLCKLRASDNGITMQDNSLPYATGPYMIGSPTHIRQIIINLLDNSIKYNKRGGSVTFSSKTKPLDDGRALFCFSVSDTGIGMAPEFLKHIYEPFAQEGDDARSKFQGTGMGMPIVKSLIELMGGTIEISSEVGVGSTFNVQIPLDIDKNPQARADTVEGVLDCSLADMNVLLAEDNELNAEIAQTLLESEGVVVTRAANGNEVVDLYLSHPAGSFDAILMDIMMPGMDGYEATRAIRLSEKIDAADIPIIALTANAFAEDAKAAHDAGMNAHLSKPLDFNKLKNMLAASRKTDPFRYSLCSTTTHDQKGSQRCLGPYVERSAPSPTKKRANCSLPASAASLPSTATMATRTPFPSTTSLTPSTTRFISMAPRLATRSTHSSAMTRSALPFTATSGTRTVTGLPTL